MLKVVRGAYGKRVAITVLNADGTAYDLADVTAASFRMWKKGAAGTLIQAACEIDEGTLYWTPQVGDLQQPAGSHYLYNVAMTGEGLDDRTEPDVLNILESPD